MKLHWSEAPWSWNIQLQEKKKVIKYGISMIYIRMPSFYLTLIVLAKTKICPCSLHGNPYIWFLGEPIGNLVGIWDRGGNTWLSHLLILGKMFCIELRILVNSWSVLTLTYVIDFIYYTIPIYVEFWPMTDACWLGQQLFQLLLRRWAGCWTNP